MQHQREKIKEKFWAKFVEPADIRLRAITGNNEALLIRGTAKELWEFIDKHLDDQLQRIIKELECTNGMGSLSKFTAIKIIEEYK